MTTKRIRILVTVVLLLTITAGAVYFDRGQSTAKSLPAVGPSMLALVDADEGAQTSVLAGPLTDDISAPIAGTTAKPASFDKDVRDLPQIGPAEKKPMREMGSPATGDAAPAGEAKDPVAQTTDGIEAMPGATASFKGLDLQNWGAGWPPDTDGDVGPSHYIQAVNTSIGIFNKTGTRLAAFTFNTFFDGTGTPCDAANQGDPVVLYDSLSGRWIITDFAWSSTRGPFYECIAVSKTTDPVAGGWWFYALNAGATALNDYPKLGVWADGIYMSANMFNRAKTYAGAKVWALNRSDMINGLPLRSVAFTLGTSYFSLIPSNLLGSTLPPTGEPAFFMSLYAPSTMRLWKFHVDWTNTSLSTFTGPTAITVASFTKPTVRVPQLGSTEVLDTLGDRLMVQLQYRNLGGVESLWWNHTVVSGAVTGLRWYEIRNPNGTPTVYQQGTYQPDTNYRWMGSLAVDKLGNMALGYSVSSSTMYPAIRYAGRLATDALGTLGQGEATLIAGTGSQSGGYNRWGDYSAMSVDPADGCTFWYTTEYYETTGNNWQTRIGAFKFPSCTP
jgi:hypothetical protein